MSSGADATSVSDDATGADGEPDGSATLSIGDLAERTGVTPATLRAWEQRHGFPAPLRLGSGHRRYRADVVDQVRGVVADRDRGLRLDQAIASALALAPGADTAGGGRSVLEVLRASHPDVTPQRLRKPSLIALSRAMEDEFCTSAGARRICGGFQHKRFWDTAEDRWSSIGASVDEAVAFAVGLGPDRPVDDHGLPTPVRRVALDPRQRARQEWFVVCESAGLPMALAAWELPGQQRTPDLERTFDVVWTLEPAVVASAARCCVALAADHGVEIAEPYPPARRPAASPAPLVMRTMSYLDARSR